MNYFYGHLKDVKTSNAQISVIKALYSDSINAKVKTIYIELENIDIIDENLQCIILPERLLVFEEFSTLKSRPGVDVKTYETNTSWFVGWHNSAVSRLLKEYLIEKGKM